MSLKYARTRYVCTCKEATTDPQIVLSLVLGPTPSIPHKRRFERVLQPYAPVNASASSHALGKMKLDLVLVKQFEGESWPTLERGEPVYGYGLTFGRRTT